MTVGEIVSKVKSQMLDYLAGEMTGEEMVRQYDAIITGDGFPWDSESEIISSLDDFHDQLSFYEANPEWRKEDKSYFDDEALREKVQRFVEILESYSVEP